MLKVGIYEQLITSALQKKLNNLPFKEFYIAQAKLDKEEAAKILSEYLVGIIQLEYLLLPNLIFLIHLI